MTAAAAVEPRPQSVTLSSSSSGQGNVTPPEHIDTADANSPRPGEARAPRETLFTRVVPADADLSHHFAAEQVDGAAVVYDPDRGVAWVHHRDRAQQRHLPASTFKIPNSVIALELGVLEDAETTLPWDGQRRWNPDWNVDRNLRDAFRFSVVPFYQEVARRVGEERMERWVNELQYGNQNIGGGIDVFWLNGELGISAYEQVDFVQRLNDGHLRISPRTRNIVRELMVLGLRGPSTLRGKTGSTGPLLTGPSVNWFVGWVEREERSVYFAVLLLDADHGHAASRNVADRILSEMGYW